ncbi:MAG: GGDEF domain-containing protein, partial [Thermoplasmata archaeon]|nr:GGDEF domain-containing protein [Thermoplasmata archaeon]
DEVLKAVGGAIVSSVRDQDVPARVGGEEFAVLLRNPGPTVALEVGERVRAAVRSLDLSDFDVPGVSVSVGVANAFGPEEPLPEVTARADRALLRAKRAGRDRVVEAA